MANILSERVGFIDAARLYGIFLVYYGHFIESMMKVGVATAAVQYKFIYSFHMPLFFVLAGYVAREIGKETSTKTYIQHRVRTRLIPFAFFATILILPTFLVSGNHGPLDLSSWTGYSAGLKATFLWGLPTFNIPTWFLLCIFSLEILHLLAGRFLNTNFRLVLAIVLLCLVGGFLNASFDVYNPLKGKLFSYLYLPEAFFIYSFYLFGIFLRRSNVFAIQSQSYLKYGLTAIPLLVIVLFTYDLNKGSFTFHVYDAVVAMFSSHGNQFWFYLTAFSGSTMVLLLAQATPKIPLITWLGSNTLVLFCLNGFFYHFVNDRLAKQVAAYSDSHISLISVGVVVTFASLLLATPMIKIFNSYLPWAVGFKKKSEEKMAPKKTIKRGEVS